ncbi:MAG: DUF4386 domain-containing protein [Gemmatimonadota bacterium]|nr:DUF4386 domain-containing protein [Gemmatimonadota bacterium]
MSPQRKARIAGVLYLVTVVTGIIAQGFIAERLVNFGDASATAANILSHGTLFRLGFTLYMIEMVSQIVMTILLYELLKPVSKSVSLVAAVIGVVGCGIKALSRLFYLAPGLVLGGSQYLNVFNAEQLNSVALLFLKVNDLGAAIALLFFGFSTLLQGYLVIRSVFLPRALGWLSVAGGIGWLAFLWPPLGYLLFPYIAALGVLGSLATILWLIVFGVNEERWTQQARVAETSIWR